MVQFGNLRRPSPFAAIAGSVIRRCQCLSVPVRQQEICSRRVMPLTIFAEVAASPSATKYLLLCNSHILFKGRFFVRFAQNLSHFVQFSCWLVELVDVKPFPYCSVRGASARRMCLGRFPTVSAVRTRGLCSGFLVSVRVLRECVCVPR